MKNVQLYFDGTALGGDADTIALKTEVARNFTSALNTSERRGAYTGTVSQALTRSMLQTVPAAISAQERRAIIDTTIARLLANIDGQFTEVQEAPRKIVLVAAPDQFVANGSRLTSLALSLTADLNGPQHPNGPKWSVDVISAASTVVAMREQLKPYHGAILVGNVPMPTFIDLGTGFPAPALDPYRTPYCSAFQFTASGNDLANRPQLTTIDPACRNGLIVSELRGRSASTQLSDVAKKLEQMIAYHSASQAHNANWAKSYRFIEAGWFGGVVLPDVTQSWNAISMYAPNMISYLSSGTGAAKRSAFVDCISKNNEMCIFDGHGAPSEIVFEGPGIQGTYYSGDSVRFKNSDIAATQVKAKYISLVSCSTHNFINNDSFGTALLMSGDALLSHGMVAVSLVGANYEEGTIGKVFSSISTGATFADAYLGRMEYSADNFQGDPYITMRPVPTGKRQAA